MNSLTGSITDSIRLYVDFNRFDNPETRSLLIRGKGPRSYEKLLSYHDNDLTTNRIIDEQDSNNSDSKAPPDKYYIAASVAFFTGVTTMLPLTFFLVANDYWMYKFRDPSEPTYDLNDKTYLQKTFVSMISVCTAFPSVISVFISARFSHKLKLRKRLLLSLCLVNFIFVFFTGLVAVNTDTWQTTFFVISLTMFGIAAFLQPLFSMAIIVYLSKFPMFYLQLNMMGAAISGLFSSCLQIISLTIGSTTTQTAMIYFCSGTAVVIFTFFLIYVMKYSATIKFYLDNADVERSNHYSAKEYWKAAKQIWFILVITIINMGTCNIGHPNITNLVVSEGYTGTDQSLWYDKYFVVVATFLLFDIFQILGRFVVRPLIKRKNAIFFITFALFRSLVLAPLLWFCNAQPRSHLPVLFPHDYQYILLLAIHSFTGSIFMTLAFHSLPSIAKEKTEQAFVLLLATTTISMTVTSPLSPVYVNLL